MQQLHDDDAAEVSRLTQPLTYATPQSQRFNTATCQAQAIEAGVSEAPDHVDPEPQWSGHTDGFPGM